jgi:hypothetical protein
MPITRGLFKLMPHVSFARRGFIFVLFILGLWRQLLL